MSFFFNLYNNKKIIDAIKNKNSQNVLKLIFFLEEVKLRKGKERAVKQGGN